MSFHGGALDRRVGLKVAFHTPSSDGEYVCTPDVDRRDDVLGGHELVPPYHHLADLERTRRCHLTRPSAPEEKNCRAPRLRDHPNAEDPRRVAGGRGRVGGPWARYPGGAGR